MNKTVFNDPAEITDTRRKDASSLSDLPPGLLSDPLSDPLSDLPPGLLSDPLSDLLPDLLSDNNTYIKKT